MRSIQSRLTAVVLTGLTVTPAFAEFSKVQNESQFVALVTGKELRRPLVNLEVSAEGRITGYGAAWPVSGEWTWKDGYFCRELEWGGDDLGYNCQEVQATGNRIRFTSDRGTGDSAEFRLR
ncbi:MAG: dihydrodipicolinate reductase [Pseudomonadota bacterium]